MSIQWADDFSSYGTTSSFMLDGLYVNVVGSIADDPDPLSTALVFSRGNGANECLRRVLTTIDGEVGFGVRVYMSNLPADTGKRWGIGLNDIDNNPICTLVCETNGSLSIRENSYTDNLVGQTVGPVLGANTWNHIEVKYISGDPGSVELRVNGIVVIDEAAIATFGGSFAQWQLNSFSGGAGYGLYLKDLVLWDTNGSFANDFLGSVQVIGLIPTSDVSFNWTSTGANGFSILDNSPPVDATDYISADDAPPAASTFGLSNLPEDTTSVKAVITQVRARKTDGGDGNLQVSLISNGDTGNGADRPMTSAFTYWTDVFHTDPDTSAPWAPSAVDAATLKLNRTV